MVGFDVLQQQINLIRRFLSNLQTPDSVITLEYIVKGQSYYRFFLVEADRGTEPATANNFNRKSHQRSILQYQEYIGGGQYRSHLGLTSSLMVLYILTDATKLKKIITLTEQHSGSAGNSYMLFRLCESFGSAFKPPKPMPEFLEGPWARAGRDNFNISVP